MRARLPILCLPILAACAAVFADTPASPEEDLHLDVRLVVPPAQVVPGQGFTAGLYFKLERGWHVYWLNAGDSGQPSSLRWTLPAGIHAGALQFPTPQRLPLGPLMDYGYENEVLFPISMTVAPDYQPTSGPVVLRATVHWLVCREVCIPGQKELSVERTVGTSGTPLAMQTSDAQLVARFVRALPSSLPERSAARFSSSARDLTLAVDTGRREGSAQFFPLDQNVITNAAPQAFTPTATGFQLTLQKDENLTAPPARLRGVISLANGRSYQISAAPAPLQSPVTQDAPSLIQIALFAFIGGLILNLMPCVFPVLFIKALALLRGTAEQRHLLRRHSVIYALGVVLTFWTIVAALLVLRGAGHELGWGFQFQSPTFVALIALTLFFLGLSLAGQFDLGLRLSGVGSELAGRKGYLGSFFTGALAVIVATPCTAPFMGAAIGYALAQSAAVTFLVFTALALGLAAPYVVLSFNPGWTRLLPRPGAWMEWVKQATAVPVFATVIWLVWVFDRTTGEVGLVAVLTAFLLLAVAGWVLGHWPARRGANASAAAVAAIAVAMSIYAALHARPTTQAALNTAADPGAWQRFAPSLVSKYRAEGRAVLVDFTASWCLSCQVNERVVLNRADVRDRLRHSGVALLRADWSGGDETITQALAALGRSGVPTYVLYPADPTAPAAVLPEVLTPGILQEALERLAAPRQAIPVARAL